MAWIAVHPSMTEDLRIPEDGPTFTLQFWPPKMAAKFDLVLARLNKAADALDPIKDFDKFALTSGIDVDLSLEMLRFGVKGWTLEEGGIACATEEVEIDGRKHTVLSKDSCEVLRVNHLSYAVTLKSILFNKLTEAQKKTSAWRLTSSSLTSATDAPAVTPTSTPEKPLEG